MLMRFLLVFAALLTGFSLFGQTNYTALSLKEKCSAKDLTFLVTFDSKSVNADFAKGDGTSTTMASASLALRGVVGFDGNNAFQPESGEMLRYKVQGNVDPHQGTLIFWTAGLDYAPGMPTNDGKHRGNIALAHLMFVNDAGQRITYQIYEYGSEVYFDWTSSEGPQRFGDVGRVTIHRTGIKKGQWHQLAFTWDDKELVGYLNGKKIQNMALPQKVNLTAHIKAQDNQASFLGVKSPFFEDKHSYVAAVDDFAVYNRPFTALEVKNQYLMLLKDKGEEAVKAYSVVLNGVVTGPKDKLDRLEAEFDFAALSPENAAQLKAGKLTLDYTLTGPDGKAQTGQWTFGQANECRILNGVDQAGKYTLETSIGKEKVSASIIRPDFSWVGNGYGDEDEVPALWSKDFGIRDRVITAWNRIYTFGEGPLPESITAYGKSILVQAPRLLIDGKEPAWKAGPTKVEKRWFTLTGTGTFGKANITYATRVEYDGFIKFDWTIKGQPEISSMKLEWQMAPENHQFLMTPHVNEERTPQVSFKYPLTGGNSKMLWFVTEKKGGFAYTMVNDANWVYDASKPVFFADKATGECRVEMITRKVKMPDETPYCALFIATPTRPLPAQNRCIHLGDARYKLLIHGCQAGLTGVFSHEPHPYDFEYRMKNKKAKSVSIYGAAGGFTTYEPELNYLKKYWEVPGRYSYNMPYYRPVDKGKYVFEHYLSSNVCQSVGLAADYYLKGQRKLYNHPYGDRVWQVYYDLFGGGICKNKYHGCCYTDKFGREVCSFDMLSVRDLARRTVAQAHRYGKTVMFHGQRNFLPMLAGMADYWFPGEHLDMAIRRNTYAYTDEVSDTMYRSEFNRDVLGVGVIFLPQLAITNKENYKKPAYKYTEAMICMLQSHDIDFTRDWAAGEPICKLWSILDKHGVQEPSVSCHLYYEQAEITSENPDLRITYYDCPDGSCLLFLANKDILPINTTVDVGKIRSGSFEAQEEYKGNPVSVEKGKFDIRVPSRNFRIVVLPSIK